MAQNHRSESHTSKSQKKNIDHLVIAAKELISATEDWIQQASDAEWNPSGSSSISFYHLVLRAILVKQYESMQAILTLEHCSQGSSAVPLLRAMCEELIWARYLASRDEEDASGIVEALGPVGIHETFLAQEGSRDRVTAYLLTAFLGDTYRRLLMSLDRKRDTPESHLDRLADEVRQDLAPR